MAVLRINVALVGIGGYGDSYLTELLDSPPKADFQLVGVVDPMPRRCRHLEELWARRVKIHADLPGLYSDARPDLVMMATPIHLHAPHTCWCLERGSNVLCEKPLAATVRDARRMVVAEKLASRFVAIGYQWSFSKAVQDLKRDIMAGNFGRRFGSRASCFSLAGRITFLATTGRAGSETAQGEPVFDSPANNAAAHYLHNMFYLLGPATNSSAMPVTVQAELYRANEIENYDTAMIRCKTDCGGAEVLFYTSHAVPPRLGPIARYEFENAVISYEAESGAGFVVRYRNGRVVRYGEPNLERNRKLWDAIRATNGGESIPCGTRAAMAHTQCIAAAQASMPQIHSFPSSMILRERLADGTMICVSGLHAAMVQCYDQAILPSEHGGLDWAAPGKLINLKDGLDFGEEPPSANQLGRSYSRDGVIAAANE